MKGWPRYAWTALYVALTTGAAWSARSLLALPDLVALYLLAIMIVAVRYGRGPSVLASGLSVLAYDVFFIEPLYTVSVRDLRHLLTFALMFTVGLVISHLGLRVREKDDALRAATLRARTEEIRSSLLSTVSHDLRTPLAVITGASTSLRDQFDALGPVARRELIDSVCEEADRMERLIENLVEMTRLESGTVELHHQWVPVEELIGSAIARVESRLGGRPLITEVPHDLPLVAVDPVFVEHALMNLLDNAIKHTPASTEISVSAHKTARTLEIRVADRGAGLPADTEPLFEKFVRQPGTHARGLGLGLAIARAVARAHGGDVVAANRPEGGAVFVLSLPLGDAPPADQVTE